MYSYHISWRLEPETFAGVLAGEERVEMDEYLADSSEGDPAAREDADDECDEDDEPPPRRRQRRAKDSETPASADPSSRSGRSAASPPSRAPKANVTSRRPADVFEELAPAPPPHRVNR